MPYAYPLPYRHLLPNPIPIGRLFDTFEGYLYYKYLFWSFVIWVFCKLGMDIELPNSGHILKLMAYFKHSPSQKITISFEIPFLQDNINYLAMA
jgi:hypothetical protein